MKHVLRLAITGIAIASSSIVSFAQKQILQLEKTPNYRSESYLRSGMNIPDRHPVLVYDVTYDKPDVFDEEFTHSLSIELVDTAALKKGKVFNVAIDTSVVKCGYMNRNHTNLITLLSQPERFPSTMIGTIKAVNWNNNEIEFEFDIAVKEGTSKGFLFYQGQKTISRRASDLGVSFKSTSNQ